MLHIDRYINRQTDIDTLYMYTYTYIYIYIAINM